MMEATKRKLSKSILEMKFMKRTKEKVEKQQFQEEGEEYFGSQLTTNMKKESGRFITEPSYVFCEQLLEGRVSFQGMNPEIEKLMELEESKKHVKTGPKEADISDEEMTRRFKSFKQMSKGKHTSENSIIKTKNEDEPVKKKPKFLKPSD